MAEPLTNLDQRFSDLGANATPWAAAREVLETAQLSWVTTVRANGRPHVTPLVAIWLDEALYFTTGPDEQKAVNLAANPHVVLITGCNRWDEGLDVMVEGEAERVTDRAILEGLAAAWAMAGLPTRTQASIAPCSCLRSSPSRCSPSARASSVRPAISRAECATASRHRSARQISSRVRRRRGFPH